MMNVVAQKVDLDQGSPPPNRVGSWPMSNAIVTLDVREDIRNGRDPFSRIMEAVDRLQAGASLCLLAPFRPAPLIAMLAEKGFGAETRQTESGDWEVLFVPGIRAGHWNLPAAKLPGDCSGPPVVEVDARGLEPPEPLVKILEAVAALPAGCRLRARTDRRPMHLYARLEERGFAGESSEQPDGSFVTLISHAKR